MNLSVGIVGLPNVGKSTLFNALLKKQQALAANYPFTTIEPNIGVVPVPDARLTTLAEIVATKELPLIPLPSRERVSRRTSGGVREGWPPLKPATVEFVDIAGLVKGASDGAGLGNKFLSHIRETKVIAHVVRAFEDPDVMREGSMGVKEDYETIQTELILSDLQVLERAKKSKDRQLLSILSSIESKLNQGIAVRNIELTDEEQEATQGLFLLSAKPEIVVLNVSEEDYSQERMEETYYQYTNILALPRENFVVICAKIESELAGLSEEEQTQYLQELGLQESGLERLIKKAYDMLGLISFLTAGEKEVRAWTVRKSASAVEAAGEIHTDFMKRFIKAEVISFDDYIAVGGRKKAREVGKARLEGKDYIVQDGDVIEFKIGS